MSRKAKEIQKEIPFGQLKWVLNNLTAEELDHLDGMDYPAEEVLNHVQRLVELGWSVSVKWDAYSSGIQATAIQKWVDKDNAGYAFSGRSADTLDCLRILCYKFFVVAGGSLSEFYVARENMRG